MSMQTTVKMVWCRMCGDRIRYKHRALSYVCENCTIYINVDLRQIWVPATVEDTSEILRRAMERSPDYLKHLAISVAQTESKTTYHPAPGWTIMFNRRLKVTEVDDTYQQPRRRVQQ